MQCLTVSVKSDLHTHAKCNAKDLCGFNSWVGGMANSGVVEGHRFNHQKMTENEPELSKSQAISQAQS